MLHRMQESIAQIAGLAMFVVLFLDRGAENVGPIYPSPLSVSRPFFASRVGSFDSSALKR